MKAYFNPYFEALWLSFSSSDANEAQWLDIGRAMEQVEGVLQALPSQLDRVWRYADLEKILGLNVFDVRIQRCFRAFLKRRTCRELKGIHQAWLAFLRRQQGVVYIRVESAYPLSEDMKIMLRHQLNKRWPLCEVAWEINAHVMGGVKCYLDDQCWDLSLKSQVDSLMRVLGMRGTI